MTNVNLEVWRGTAEADNEEYMSGAITDKEYWGNRVGARDAALAEMSPDDRARVNGA